MVLVELCFKSLKLATSAWNLPNSVLCGSSGIAHQESYTSTTSTILNKVLHFLWFFGQSWFGSIGNRQQMFLNVEKLCALWLATNCLITQIHYKKSFTCSGENPALWGKPLWPRCSQPDTQPAFLQIIRWRNKSRQYLNAWQYKPGGQLQGSGFVEACLKICSSRIEPRILLQGHPKEKYC